MVELLLQRVKFIIYFILKLAMNMKALAIVVFGIMVFSAALHSQNDVKQYQAPEIMSGKNLTVNFFGSLSAYKNHDDSSGSRRGNFQGSVDYINWKFARKLNYVINASSSLYGNTKKYGTTNNESENSAVLNAGLRSVFSYYMYKNFYAGTGLNLSSSFETSIKPLIASELFPFIGYGRLYNAGQTTNSFNFEKVLKDEKIIRGPLSYKVKRELTEILDRRNTGEYTSKYLDDSEIEFYSEVEEVLMKNGIISEPMDARTILKLVQSLSNSKFVRYPVYKGYELQCEVHYLVNKLSEIDDYPDSRMTTLTAGSTFGIPIRQRLNMIGSLFVLLPLNKNYINSYGIYNYHSPAAIRESREILYYNIPPANHISYGGIIYSLMATTVADVFYSINSFTGISLHSQVDIGKIKDGGTQSYFQLGLSYSHNILSRLQFGVSAYFLRSYIKQYDVESNFSLRYNFF